MRRGQAEELERRLTVGSVVSPSADVEAWATLAEQLRTVTPVALVPRPAFRDDLRSRLMAEAAELGPARPVNVTASGGVAITPKGEGPARTGRPRPTLRRVRRSLAGVVVAAVLGGGAAAVASTGAVPGDALYGLKRAVEDVRMQLAGSDPAKGGAALGQARERLGEAEDLALSSSGGDRVGTDSPELREALGDFATSSEEGIDLLLQHYAAEGEPESLADVDTFVRETLPLLERLRTETPASLHPVIDTLIFDLQGTSGELASTVAACGEPCSRLGLVATGSEPEPRPSVSASSPAPGGIAGSLPGALLPGGPTVTVPGEAVADPAAPGDGVPPGDGIPLPGQSVATDPLAPVTDPLAPITDPLAPVTDLLDSLTDPLLSPSPAPAPPPGLPCIVNILGNCSG